MSRKRLVFTGSFSVTGALQITGSEERDQGTYECVANNSAGTEYSKSAMLYVKGTGDTGVSGILIAVADALTNSLREERASPAGLVRQSQSLSCL